MSQAYNCLPTDLWTFDPTTPKGFYFNRGIYYFGRLVEGEMKAAEANARKNRKGAVADRMANAARLGVLGKHLGEEIKRHKDPGNVQNRNPNRQHGSEALDNSKDTTVVIKRGF